MKNPLAHMGMVKIEQKYERVVMVQNRQRAKEPPRFRVHGRCDREGDRRVVRGFFLNCHRLLFHRMFVSLSLALLWHSSRLLNSQATQRFYSKKAPGSAEYRRYRYTSDPCGCHLPFTPRIIPADGTRLWRSNYLSYLLRGRSRTLPTRRMRAAVQRT
jgi:hypothetical protein